MCDHEACKNTILEMQERLVMVGTALEIYPLEEMFEVSPAGRSMIEKGVTIEGEPVPEGDLRVIRALQRVAEAGIELTRAAREAREAIAATDGKDDPSRVLLFDPRERHA